jgi:hypothetical protein
MDESGSEATIDAIPSWTMPSLLVLVCHQQQQVPDM